MGAARFEADALVDLALAAGVPPVLRIVLLAAERADANGVAAFDEDELHEMLGEKLTGAQRKLSRAQVRHKITLLERLGYALPGSTDRRILLDTEHIRPLGWGLRVVTTLDGGRVLAECDSGHRATYRDSWLEQGTAKCAKCSKAAA